MRICICSHTCTSHWRQQCCVQHTKAHSQSQQSKAKLSLRTSAHEESKCSWLVSCSDNCLHTYTYTHIQTYTHERMHRATESKNFLTGVLVRLMYRYIHTQTHTNTLTRARAQGDIESKSCWLVRCSDLCTHTNTQTQEHTHTVHNKSMCSWPVFESATRYTATHCNTLQRTATHRNILQHTATHCNTLQHTATHCNALRHTATYCNTLTYDFKEPTTDMPRDVSYMNMQSVMIGLPTLWCANSQCTTLHTHTHTHMRSELVNTCYSFWSI